MTEETQITNIREFLNIFTTMLQYNNEVHVKLAESSISDCQLGMSIKSIDAYIDRALILKKLCDMHIANEYFYDHLDNAAIIQFTIDALNTSLTIMRFAKLQGRMADFWAASDMASTSTNILFYNLSEVCDRLKEDM